MMYSSFQYIEWPGRMRGPLEREKKMKQERWSWNAKNRLSKHIPVTERHTLRSRIRFSSTRLCPDQISFLLYWKGSTAGIFICSWRKMIRIRVQGEPKFSLTWSEMMSWKTDSEACLENVYTLKMRDSGLLCWNEINECIIKWKEWNASGNVFQPHLLIAKSNDNNLYNT